VVTVNNKKPRESSERFPYLLPKKVSKRWGREVVFVNVEESGASYCGKILELVESGTGSRWERHPGKDEALYVLSGEVEVVVEGMVARLGRGEGVRLRRGTWHQFRLPPGVNGATLVEACTFHEARATERKSRRWRGEGARTIRRRGKNEVVRKNFAPKEAWGSGNWSG